MSEPVELRTCLGSSPEFEMKNDQYVVRKAIRERWPITPEMREKVLNKVTDVLEAFDSEESLKLTAARTIVQIDALNLKEKEIQARLAPKHIIHTNLSNEELVSRIKELSQELGVMMPKAALECLGEKSET